MAAWLFTAFWLALGTAAPSHSTECAATPKRDLLPNVIAPMTGDAPVWFIETTGGLWQGANTPIKSVWVLSRQHTGQLRASGRLRGTASAGALRFRRGTDGPLSESLSISNPLAESMIPGGASADVMNKFAFVSSYIYFPTRGCWQITSEWGGVRRSVVIHLK